MANKTGVVSKINAKEWAGRNGVVVLYSFVLEGDKTWFRTGTMRPTFNEGDSISFEYTTDGRGGNTVTEGSVVKQAPQVSKAPAVKGGGNAKDGYWEEKDRHQKEVVEPRITHAAARKDAIAVVGLALAHDAIVFGNAAKGARLGIILAAVDETTKRFVDQVNGNTDEADTELDPSEMQEGKFND